MFGRTSKQACIMLSPDIHSILSHRTCTLAPLPKGGQGQGKWPQVTYSSLSQTGASPGRHSAMGPCRPWMGPVKLFFNKKSIVLLLDTNFEAGLNYDFVGFFTFYSRTALAPSPHCQNEGRQQGKNLTVNCTCLSQTGASPGRHSAMGPGHLGRA